MQRSGGPRDCSQEIETDEGTTARGPKSWHGRSWVRAAHLGFDITTSYPKLFLGPAQIENGSC